LDAGLERPELRTFSFDPVETVLADRGKYVAAALTVVAAFLASGEKPPMVAIASYGDWSATVRAALIWLGRPDPALSMEAAREYDPELAELRDMMLAWAAAVGVNEPATLKRVVGYADERQRDPETGTLISEYRDHALRHALMTLASERGAISTGKLGKWLRGRKGRIVSLALPNKPAGQYRFEAAGETHGIARGVLRGLAPKAGKDG